MGKRVPDGTDEPRTVSVEASAATDGRPPAAAVLTRHARERAVTVVRGWT